MSTSPTLSLYRFTLSMAANAPDTTGGWRVQYFHGATALTVKSKTFLQRVELADPGTYEITAVWTKTGRQPVTSEVSTFILDAQAFHGEDTPDPEPPDPPEPEPVVPPSITSPTAGATVAGSFGVTVHVPAFTTLCTVNLVNASHELLQAWSKSVTSTSAAQNVTVSVTVATQENGAYTLVPVATVNAVPVNGAAVAVTVLNVAPPDPPIPGDKRVLTSADFTYLGCMRVPDSGVYMAGGQGSMSGRVVSGQVRLLMLGDRSQGDPLYEFADTGSYNADVSAAPRMSLVRAWGDIYGDARKSWNPDGTERLFADDDPYRYMAALHFNSTTGLLYWTFRDVYNTTAIEDWCLGATRLDESGPVAFGPWRPRGEGTRVGPWVSIQFGQHPTSGEFLCGSGVQSGNHTSPWGPDMWAGAFPTTSTPAGFNAPDLPVSKYVTYYPMYPVIAHDGTFTGPLKACRRGDYLFEPILGDSTYAQIDPLKNSGVGSWSEVDSIGSAQWFDFDNSHGVVFIGRFGAKHIWYRNAGQGNDKCTHGLSSPIEVTGPVSTEAYPIFIIYDPRVLADVRAGHTVDYTASPASIVNVESTYGVTTAPMTETTSKLFSGSFFNSATGKLYICAPSAETIGIEKVPVVHVFQVATT